MITLISLLRGVNVGSQNKIRMTDLQNLYCSLGLEQIVTYIQSGNVIFNCAEEKAAGIAGQIEAGILQAFGCKVRVLLRSRDELKQVLEHNPFLNQRHADPLKLYVTFLADAPDEGRLKNLAGPPGGEDEFSIQGREVYLFCPNGYGRTKLNNTFFEKKLGVDATTRNWNTIRTLYEMASAR